MLQNHKIPELRISEHRHCPTTRTIASSKSSGLILRNNKYDYWLELGFNGQRFVSEAKNLMMTRQELQTTLKQPIAIFQTAQNENYEFVSRYYLAEESKKLLADGWRHAILQNAAHFITCIAKVSCVSGLAMAAAAWAANASMAIPIGLVVTAFAISAKQHFTAKAEAATVFE